MLVASVGDGCYVRESLQWWRLQFPRQNQRQMIRVDPIQTLPFQYEGRALAVEALGNAHVLHYGVLGKWVFCVEEILNGKQECDPDLLVKVGKPWLARTSLPRTDIPEVDYGSALLVSCDIRARVHEPTDHAFER